VTPPSSSRPWVSAAIALLLVVPVPTAGVVAALHAAPGPAGRAVFAAAKLWLLLFPAAWFLVMERGRPGWSRPERGGLGAGAALGAVMVAAIVLAYWGVLRDLVDPRPLRHAALDIGIGSPGRLPRRGGGLDRRQLPGRGVRLALVRPAPAAGAAAAGPAILGSAALFTVHHIFAMAAYLEPTHVVLGSAAVLTAGACWSWLYLRYDSIWPGWISHLAADVAVFLVGWQLLFSRTG